MGTVSFPTSTTNDPAYYEISGGGFAYPVCDSLFPVERFCIQYFTASGDSYLLGTVINNNFYAYLQLADSANDLNPVSDVPFVPSPGQYKSDGITPISEGGTTTQDTLALKSVLQSSSANQLRLEVEVEPFRIPFTNAASATSGPVNSGQTASVKLTVFTDGYYHWQARAVDTVTGAGTDWREFGTTGNTDFVVDTTVHGAPLAYNFQDQSGNIGTDNGGTGPYNGPLSVSIQLGKPSASPTNPTVQFYQNGTTGCVDPGYSFQGYTDGTYVTTEGPGLGLGSYTDASGTPISLRDYTGLVKATVFGTFNLNDYYTFSFGSCDFSRPVSIKGNPGGKYACTFIGGPFGLYCYGALYAGADPYLIVSGLPGSSLGGSPAFGFTHEPINTATGNYFLSRTDVTVSGIGLSLSFTRSYNSIDGYAGPLGAGWTHSYNILISVDPNSGVVTIKEADGHQAWFNPAGGGTYTPVTAGLFDTLLGNADGTFILTRKNQTKFNFSAVGQLTSIVDRNGNTQTLSYDGSGHLTSVTDTAGRSFTFAYDGAGHATSLTDPLGRSWQYGYDASGNLVSVRDAAGGVTHYAYDASHRIISAIDPRGVTFLQNTYDTSGRVATQTNGRGFVTTLDYNFPAAGTTTFTDPLVNATQHVYDSSLRLVQVIDAKGGTVSYTYDANNDRISITNQNGNTTNFTFDANGNTTGITDPLGNATAFTYDAKNNLLTATNPKGNTTTFSYDANGNLTRIADALGNTTAFAYGALGLLNSKTDARGNTTSYAYDSAGDLTKIADALGNATNLSYDGVGRLLSLTDPNGHTATVAYDALNRLVKTMDPLGHATQFSYDAVGNLLKIADANGNATAYAYDSTNDLASVTDALGGVTSYTYDANNNRASFKNAKGNTTAYAYDALNRLTQITDPLSFTTSYAYDAVGNAVSTTDANGQTNQYTYDALNRLAKGSYADGSSITYAYDKDRNRTSMADSRGATSYSYDALDRVLSVTSPGGAVVQYAYDALGNRISLTYPDGRNAQYQYDALNRLTQVTDWSGKSTRYTYDATGNLLGFAHPNGAASSYSYDAANRLLQIVNRSGSQVLSAFTYTLDEVGNRLQVTSAAGGVTKYGYDALHRLISWTTPSGQATQYNYDPAGNRLSMVSSAGTISYTYNAADELLTAGATTFAYDHNGNQISKTTGTTIINYTYDTLNRLTAVSGGGINSRYSYDGDGNRVNQAISTGTYQYVNDTATPLPVVLNENGPDGNIEYLYGDSLISENSSAFQYFYQSDGLGSTASLTDPTGALKANYAYDPWGKLLVPMDPLGTKNKYKYSGEASDPGTGLYFLRARYYDTGGRFLGRDSFGGFAFVPNSLNRYEYGLENPTRLNDPTGLFAVDDEMSSQAPAMVTRTLQLAGPTFQLSNIAPGPAFTKAAGNFILDQTLGDFFSLAKQILISSYNLVTNPSPGTIGNETKNVVESAMEFITNKTVGLAIGIFDLLTVPEIAVAPSSKP